MNDQTQAPQTLSYRVGEWLVSPSGSRLTRSDEETHVTPRTMDVLVHLIERAGETVSNDELVEAYWVGGITSTNAVHKAIGELRQVFGDDRHQARYIETVQKRGYRLVAEVARIEVPTGAPLSGNGQKIYSDPEPVAEVAAINGAPAIADDDPPVRPSRLALRHVAAWSLAGLVIVAVSSASLYRAWSPFTALVDRAIEYCFASCETKIATVAILPFRNLSTDPADEYLGEGMAVALTEGIARSKEIALTHPQQTDGRPATEVAKALGVENLLAGTVQRSGDRLRVTLELTRANDGVELYSGTFDDSVDHLFELQDDMSRVVGRALSVHLDPFRRAEMIAGGTTNAESYLANQEATFYFGKSTFEDARKGIEASRRAVALDPKNADAYWCAIVHTNNFAWRGWTTQQITIEQHADLVEELKSMVQLAGKDVPLSGVAQAGRWVFALHTGDFVGEEVALRELIKLPEAVARRQLSPEGHYTSVLLNAGLYHESQAYEWLTLELADETPEWRWENVLITLQREGPLPVIARYKLGVNQNPQDVSQLTGLINLLAHEGKYQEAEQYLEMLRTADKGGVWLHHAEAMIGIYRGTVSGDSAELKAYLASPLTENIGAGQVLFMLGDVDGGIKRWEALDAAGRVFLKGNRLHMEYHLPQAVLADARYQALLNRLGVGEQWRHYLEDKVRELEPYTGIGLASDHPGQAPPGVWRWKI